MTDRTVSENQSDAKVREPRVKQELTDYERGYVDGLLNAAYRNGNGDVVIRRGETTYKRAAERFMHERGLEGWTVNVH